MKLDDNLKMVEVDNKQIAKMAFYKLCDKKKNDSALRLANCILSFDSITLGLGDIDWDIEMALDHCGGKPMVGRRYLATFNFKGKTRVSEEQYERLISEFYD